MAEYRLTPAAVADLEGIWRYTVQRWGVEQAIAYTDALTRSFGDLAARPSEAIACDDIRQGYRRKTVEHHTVYLTVHDYGIAVVRILHKAMDAPRHV